MLTAVKEEVEVMPGGILQIHAGNLKPHTKAFVMAVIEVDEKPRSKKLASLVGSGRGLYETPEEVDAFIRRERNSWS
jgi:hypothetical protein